MIKALSLNQTLYTDLKQDAVITARGNILNSQDVAALWILQFIG